MIYDHVLNMGRVSIGGGVYQTRGDCSCGNWNGRSEKAPRDGGSVEVDAQHQRHVAEVCTHDEIRFDDDGRVRCVAEDRVLTEAEYEALLDAQPTGAPDGFGD